MKHQQQVEELMTNMKGCITLKPHDAKSRPESVVIMDGDQKFIYDIQYRNDDD